MTATFKMLTKREHLKNEKRKKRLKLRKVITFKTGISFCNFIIKNSDLEVHRNRNLELKIRKNDLIVCGTYQFSYSPLKRKLHKSVKLNSKGLSHYTYNKTSSRFFLDNKLKVLKSVTNRFVDLKDLYITNDFLFSRDWKKISSKKSLRIEDIVDIIFNVIGDNVIPDNIYTNDPIICEILVFLFQNFIINQMKKEKHRKKIEVVYFVNSITKNKFINSKYYVVKKRSCPLNQVNIKTEEMETDKQEHYSLQDQTLLIMDDNTNDVQSVKIKINLPLFCIAQPNEKYMIDLNYYDDKYKKIIEKRERFYKTHISEISKYFVNNK